MRRCQEPGCEIRLRPGNTTEKCFKHGGKPPEQADKRTTRTRGERVRYGATGKLTPRWYDFSREHPPPAVTSPPEQDDES